MIYGNNYNYIIHKCKLIADVCKELKIDTIAGPVSSGVSIAVAVFIVANEKNYPLNALLLGKKGYIRHKHYPCVKFLGNFDKIKNILMVDDIVSSGDSLLYALDEIKESDIDANVIGCLSSCFSNSSLHLIKNNYPSIRFFHLLYDSCVEIKKW